MTGSQPYTVCIDDDDLSRQILEMMLVLVMGYPQPTLFNNTKNILTHLSALEHVPEIIFLDIQITPHDGYTVAHWLRDNNRYDSTKIVAVTASLHGNEAGKLRQAGFNGLIIKPISQHLFPTQVCQILAGEPVWDLGIEID
jgi:two-component system sensor histidine kinase BarA